MSLEDWTAVDGKSASGGQGTVRKVRHKVDGRVGALKLLHKTRQSERRYRFLTEVSALRAMAGNGVPAVLEANEREWENPRAKLYIVMEFIEGPTMQALCDALPPTLDQSLAATRRILEILHVGHQLPLLHRDLKSNNVILRAGRWEDPVLVDFGIAWYRSDPEVGFRTPSGIEVGNRFLRLPEFAPGGRHYDIRSDVAMAAGLLFFMLSGRAPRALVDDRGRHPHEVTPSPIFPAVLEDLRWTRLSQLLRVAFQHTVAARFQSAQEFSDGLAALDQDNGMQQDAFERSIEQLNEAINSAAARERAAAAGAMKNASNALYSELSRLWKEHGLQHGGQNPTFKNGGSTIEFYCMVSRDGQADPAVMFRHCIELRDGRLLATCSIGDAAPVLHWNGSSADEEGLVGALLATARLVSADIIRQLAARLAPPDITQFT